jgi:hypothetical protein
MNEKDLIPIGEASEILGISIDTLRRWDKSGKFPAEKSEGGHRLYSRVKIGIYLQDLLALAQDWCKNQTEIPGMFYCQNSGVFQARLGKMYEEISKIPELEHLSSLVLSVSGEIGNNSFDHNIGNWPDVPGIFFGYDIARKQVMLADRGIGVLASLKRVRPSLNTDEAALAVAFTEVLSGRAPEERGNGLKFVKKVITENPMGLVFQSGNTEVMLHKNNTRLQMNSSQNDVRGCLAFITF